MQEVLKTSNLLIGYKGQALMPAINVSLNEGDIVALAGPNGSGKTTLFKTLSASLKPVGGEVKLFGKDLRDYSPPNAARSSASCSPRSPTTSS